LDWSEYIVYQSDCAAPVAEYGMRHHDQCPRLYGGAAPSLSPSVLASGSVIAMTTNRRGWNAMKRAVSGQGGFTLIEMMIVVAIVAVLALIAYPSYQNAVREGRRGDAKSDLIELSQMMERSRPSPHRRRRGRRSITIFRFCRAPTPNCSTPSGRCRCRAVIRPRIPAVLFRSTTLEAGHTPERASTVGN
jgi:prepilin-type N-terminal cleavage/methylation domain-containing protein